MVGEGRLREREEHGLGSRKERKSEKKREGGRLEYVVCNFISMFWTQTMLYCDQKHAFQHKGCVGLNFEYMQCQTHKHLT